MGTAGTVDKKAPAPEGQAQNNLKQRMGMEILSPWWMKGIEMFEKLLNHPDLGF